MQIYNQKQKKILHITTHLGGGIGSVLFNYFSKIRGNVFFSHSVVCLNYADRRALIAAKKIGLELFDMMHKEKRKLLEMIAKSDIVVIHWWSHPLLYDFLVREQLPPSRIIIWSHVSGYHPPSVFTTKLLSYPDKFVFTTPISFQTQEVKHISNKIKKRFSIIWSTTDISRMLRVKQKKHSGFNVGYIGTVDYAKLHPHFLDICSRINIPGVKFIICGGPYKKELQKKAEKMGIASRFNFNGHVYDITKYLPIFDVFGYPLTPSHYGTCDQVLQESMAAGVVPVVFANRMEKTMVKSGVTGIVVKDERNYTRAIEKLYKDKRLRDVLSNNAKKYATQNFSTDKMIGEWETIFREVLTVRKARRNWPIKGNMKMSPSGIFLESLGNYGKIFSDYCSANSENKKIKAIGKIVKMGKAPAWRSETKGTVHNYNSFLPGDKYLSLWSRAMKGEIDLKRDLV